MKKNLTAILLLAMTGCAYKSVIIVPRNNGDATILYNRLIDSINNPPSNSILNNTISSKELLDRKSTGVGYVHIFLSNSNMFIDAKQVYQNSDLAFLQGTIFNKTTNDTLNFSIEYSLQEMEYLITKQRRENFILNLIPTEKFRSDSLKQEFVFSKTKNFIIQDDIFELYTGEIYHKKTNTFKYVIVNDPEEFSKTLMSVCILTIVDLESAAADCKAKFKNQCPKGYEAKLFWSWLLYKNVNCECKQ